MINRSLAGISGLMEPRITALRKVDYTRRFDPLLTRSLWWDQKEGDDTLVTRTGVQRNTTGIIGYGQRKKRPMTIPPPAVNLEKRYKLQNGGGLRQAGGGLRMAGQGLRMAGQGLRMAGQSGSGLPIRLSNARSMNYS